MLVRLIVTSSLLLALAACAGQAAPTSSSDTASAAATQSAAGTASAAPSSSLVASAPTAVPTLSASSAVNPGAAGEAPSDASAAAPQLLLEAGGLGVVVDETRIEHLPFGTAASTIRGAVTHLLGPLTTTRRTDCEQGVLTSSTVRGFELLFRGSRFVGWTDTGAKGRHLTTGDGIGVGVSVRTLLHSGTDVTIQRLDGSTEGEWTSGPTGLYGRSTSVAPTGKVTVISSGETCLGD